MISKNPKILGAYFEALWEFYLHEYPGKKLIAKNLQVFGNGKTIGEFDFIYLDETTGKHYHLEVAIKYYLGIDNTMPNGNCRSNDSSHFYAQNWLGPNTRDSFDRKYQKMFSHQSQLSCIPEAKECLKSIGISRITPKICLLGYLFYPLNTSNAQRSPMYPVNASVNHNRGYWLRISQMQALLPKFEMWGIRGKPHWLASVKKKTRELYGRDVLISTLQTHFNQCQRPILISNFNQVEHDSFESEILFFIVPDAWPNLAN